MLRGTRFRRSVRSLPLLTRSRGSSQHRLLSNSLGHFFVVADEALTRITVTLLALQSVKEHWVGLPLSSTAYPLEIFCPLSFFKAFQGEPVSSLKEVALINKTVELGLSNWPAFEIGRAHV